jgi:hypothetical protein
MYWHQTKAVQSECDHFLPQFPQIINHLPPCTGIKLKQCNQNVTTSCHSVHKLSITCHCVLSSNWSSATECDHFLPQCPQIINHLSLCTGIKLKQCNRMWPLPVTVSTNYQSGDTVYWHQTEQIRNCSKFWTMDKKFIVWQNFVLLRQEFLSGGKSY